MERLGFLIPTNSPDTFKSLFLPSIDNLLSARKYVKFLINFQKPWTEDEISEVVSEIRGKGFSVDYRINSYSVEGKGLVPFNRIRNDAFLIDTSLDYYMITDDDMVFLPESPSLGRDAGDQILEDIIFLDRHPEFGVIFHRGRSPLYRYVSDSIFGEDYKKISQCNEKGIVFRVIEDSDGVRRLFPEGSEDLLGSDEEKVLISYRLNTVNESEGVYYQLAVHPYFRIRHWEHHGKVKDSGAKKYNWNLDSIRNQNNFKYIRDHYNPRFTSTNKELVGTIVPRSQVLETIDNFSMYLRKDLEEMLL